MTLNDLLIAKGIHPKQVIVMRHRPHEPSLNKVFPWLAAEHPDIYNAYQQTQGEKVERVMQKVKYVASFIGRGAGKALFIGLYSVDGWDRTTIAECSERPAVAELLRLGMQWGEKDLKRDGKLWFHLNPVAAFHPEWKGRLVINWPPPERSWWRRAHNHDDMAVLAIREESALNAHMPPWDKIVLRWEELAMMPTAWKAALHEWRGVYYIFDTSDGKATSVRHRAVTTCSAAGWGTRRADTAGTPCSANAIIRPFGSQFFNGCHPTCHRPMSWRLRIHGRSGFTRGSMAST